MYSKEKIVLLNQQNFDQKLHIKELENIISFQKNSSHLMEQEIADLNKKNQSLVDQMDKLNIHYIQDQNKLIEDSKITICELNAVLVKSQKDLSSMDFLSKTLSEKQVC